MPTTEANPHRNKEPAQPQGTAGRAHHLCGLPWGSCSYGPGSALPTLHAVLHWQPERGQSERTAPSGSWYPAIASMPLPSGSALLPSSPGGLSARTDFSGKSFSWSVQRGPVTSQEVPSGRPGAVAARYPGGAGNRHPWASTALFFQHGSNFHLGIHGGLRKCSWTEVLGEGESSAPSLNFAWPARLCPAPLYRRALNLAC